MWIEEMSAMVEESGSSEIYSLVKRPDEKFVTEKAYDNPVFVEDLVRNVAVRCNRHPDITWYKVEAENMESIHNHSAYACIEKTPAGGMGQLTLKAYVVRGFSLPSCVSRACVGAFPP